MASCQYRSIKLEVIRHSSDLMECTKIFGNSLKKIDEENEMLIQTGTYYGLNDSDDRQAAIVKIDHTEKTLYLTAEMTISGETTEVYKNDEYSLSLKYTEKKVGDNISYVGACRIKKGILMSEYPLVGTPNIHNY